MHEQRNLLGTASIVRDICGYYCSGAEEDSIFLRFSAVWVVNKPLLFQPTQTCVQDRWNFPYKFRLLQGRPQSTPVYNTVGKNV